MSGNNKRISKKRCLYRQINKNINDIIVLSDIDFDIGEVAKRAKITSLTHESSSEVSPHIATTSTVVFSEEKSVNINANSRGYLEVCNNDDILSDQSNHTSDQITAKSTANNIVLSNSYCNIFNEKFFFRNNSRTSLNNKTSDSNEEKGLTHVEKSLVHCSISENISSNANSSQIFLRNWSIEHNITHNALDGLLAWLKTKLDIYDLPQCARTLLKTPVTIEIELMGDGEFFYFGLEPTIKMMISQYPKTEEVIYLDFNVDGLPLHKSTNISFWPILCKVNLALDLDLNKNMPVFAVAIFCGKNKPPLDNFLDKFVTELLSITTVGIKVNDRIHKVIIQSFCCDTPARSFIKRIKSHNAYYGCDKCMDPGVYNNHRIQFLTLSSEERTNNSFRNKINEEHHKGTSPLEVLPINMITCFPLDYMHNVCLGVMRKLLFYWRDGSRTYRICGDKLVSLKNRIAFLQAYWPREFNRRPRCISELERWKATELRQFLIYIGPVVLKHILPEKVYGHFMLLKFSLTILLVKKLNKDYNDYAKCLLKIFVKNTIKIYGQDCCIYNIHSLIHLADEAKLFGTLNAVNCFTFENHLQGIKKMLRKSNLPLQQIVRRIKEKPIDLSSLSETTDLQLSGKKQLVKDCVEVNNVILQKYIDEELYEKLHFTEKNILLSNRRGNNIIMLMSGEIVQCLHFLQFNNTYIIIGKNCTIIKPFTQYPEDSSLLSLFEIKVGDGLLIDFPVHNVAFKGVVIPDPACSNDQTFIFSPLIHLLDFYVVEFPDEVGEDKEIPMALIPGVWLNLEENICLWPNNTEGKFFYRAVKEKQTLNPLECRTCNVNIKYRTNDYDKALARLKDLEKLGTLSSSGASDEEIPGRRKIKANSKYDDYYRFESQKKNSISSIKSITSQYFNEINSDSSGSEDQQLPDVPSIKNFKPSKKSKKICGTNLEQNPTENLKESKKTIEFTETNNLDRTLTPQYSNEQEPVITFINLFKAMARLEALIKQSIRKIEVLKDNVDYLTTTVLSQEDRMKNQQSEIYNIEELPVKTLDALQEFEQKLEDPGYFSSVSTKLIIVGGNDAAETMRRFLPLMISHEVSLKVNWSGRNEKTAFQKLKNIRNLIIGVVRRNPKCKDVTVAAVDAFIKQWLRTAADREGGRERRRNKRDEVHDIRDQDQ